MNAATKTWTTAVTLAALLSSTAGTLAQSRPPWEAGAAPDAGAAAAAPPGQTIPGAGPVPGQVQMPAPAMSMAPAATGMPASTLLGATRSGTRPGESLGLTQKAWEDPEKHMGRGQTAPGYRRLEWAANRILPVNTREGLITTIAWPASENVVQVIVSDPASFEAAPSPDKHAIAVKPIYPGVDGNLVVYGSSGKIYNVYLKSTSYNDPTLSDMRVSVDVPSEGAESGDAGGGTGAGGAGGRGGSSTAGVRSDDPSDALTRPRARGGAIGRDFAATAATGPGRLRTDLEIMVSDPADSIIAPVAAWRDDKFTYLDYGPRAASMNVWPVASLVVDQVESPVGTRVAGPNRSVLVVEALGDVVLRNGTHVVCVKLDVVNHDNRKPAADEVYRDRPGLPARGRCGRGRDAARDPRAGDGARDGALAPRPGPGARLRHRRRLPRQDRRGRRPRDERGTRAVARGDPQGPGHRVLRRAHRRRRRRPREGLLGPAQVPPPLPPALTPREGEPP